MLLLLQKPRATYHTTRSRRQLVTVRTIYGSHKSFLLHGPRGFLWSPYYEKNSISFHISYYYNSMREYLCIVTLIVDGTASDPVSSGVGQRVLRAFRGMEISHYHLPTTTASFHTPVPSCYSDIPNEKLKITLPDLEIEGSQDHTL